MSWGSEGQHTSAEELRDPSQALCQEEGKFSKKTGTFFPCLHPSPLRSGDHPASQGQEKQALSSVPTPFNPGSLSLLTLKDTPGPSRGHPGHCPRACPKPPADGAMPLWIAETLGSHELPQRPSDLPPPPSTPVPTPQISYWQDQTGDTGGEKGLASKSTNFQPSSGVQTPYLSVIGPKSTLGNLPTAAWPLGTCALKPFAFGFLIVHVKWTQLCSLGFHKQERHFPQCEAAGPPAEQQE